MNNFKSSIPWILIILLNICLWMQIKMNHDKSVRIERLESCISRMIDEQNAHNSK